MTIRRVALVYDDTVRKDTTGTYCRRALEKLVEVEHFLPQDISTIPRTGFDLYLNVDDGLRYRFPADLQPSAFWAIDTHLDFAWYRTKAADFDFVAAAQRDGAEQLAREGIVAARWLPLACDPEVHRKHDVPKRHDVCFVGNLAPGDRSEAVRLLQRQFENTFVGRRYFDEMAEMFSASRIVFNRSILGDVNMRVFEALACGSLLVTNDLTDNGQAELFHNGQHLVTYGDLDELVEKVRYYLAHEDERERIAAAGREAALAAHTYRHRMETLLGDVQKMERKTVTKPAAATTQPTPAPSYYEFSRPELLAAVPKTARQVLDVGCAAGRLGEAIKARQDARVCGIELNRDVAEAARTRLDEVIVGDVDDMEFPFDQRQFDCIVCGDVLEHLRAPERFLQQARRWLGPDGRLIASIPNVRHHSVIRGLLAGNWSYEPAGILDRTHLRFFTRREIEKLFYRAGYKVSRVEPIRNPGYDAWCERGRPGELCTGPLQVRGLGRGDAEEFHTIQYLVEAAPRAVPDRGRTSIIILTHNQIECTRLCVDSILRYTDEPIEWIFVDNASTDGTPDYLRTVPGAKLIVNAENRGFPAGVNQGIEAATGENVLLLNNDVIVTTGWLDRLLTALYSADDVGLVGPVSNNVSGSQQIVASYEDLAELDGFAWDHGKRNDGRYFATDRLVGFAMLIRRDVIERIGQMDERFGVGCFEDDDFCRRAAEAGYRLLIASDAFLHHFGSQTFRASGVDLGQVLRENEQIYRKKWDNDDANDVKSPSADAQQTAPQPAGGWSIRSRPEGGLLLEPDRPLVSLCMICRDNADTIEACLDSIRPWVDEMIVVDTGSTDNTPELVQSCGAQLHHFPWCDDFATARNESLRHARGEWVFWMDSDDTIDETNGRKLREVLTGDRDPSLLGYVMQVHCPGAGEDGKTEVTVVDHVKLFRNRDDLRFEGRIHEQILPAIRRAGGEVAFTDVFVVHSGADHTPEGHERKLQRDFRLLELDLKDRPDHPFVLFNLGMTHADAGNHEEAVKALRRSLEVSQPSESHLRKVYALLIGSYSQLGQYEEAWQTCQEGRRHFPEDAELLFREGVLHQHFGRLAEAEQAYLQVLGNHGPRHFASVDRGIGGFKARHNLALVYEALGDLPKAEAQWRQVVAEEPTYRAGWRGLGDVLLWQDKLEDVDEVTQLLRDQPSDPLRAEAFLLQGRAAQRRGDHAQAEWFYQEAVDRWPDDGDALHARSQFLFEHGPPEAAQQALKDLAERFPDDAAAWHNLGSLHFQAGRYEEAIDAYRESLRLRPDYPLTRTQLEHALRMTEQSSGHALQEST